jgi:hypothetical protein
MVRLPGCAGGWRDQGHRAAHQHCDAPARGEPSSRGATVLQPLLNLYPRRQAVPTGPGPKHVEEGEDTSRRWTWGGWQGCFVASLGCMACKDTISVWLRARLSTLHCDSCVGQWRGYPGNACKVFICSGAVRTTEHAARRLVCRSTARASGSCPVASVGCSACRSTSGRAAVRDCLRD